MSSADSEGELDLLKSNLAELEGTYRSCLEENESDASEFVSSMIRRECERDADDPDLILIYLKLCGNNQAMNAVRLVDSDIGPICQALQLKPCIGMLDLRYNRITNRGATLIAEWLKVDTILQELNLVGNDITEEGAEDLAAALKVNRTLRVLKLTGNPIGTLGGLRIAQALQINNTLTLLDVGECDQSITSSIAFATMLRQNKSLRAINLNRQLLWTVQEEVTVHIADMLKVNRTLKELHLAKVDMRDFGAKRIADVLPRNNTLEILDISTNRIARDGAEAIAKVIAIDPPLVILDLAFNRIQCNGAKVLAAALLKNTNLKVLAVQYCEIKGPGLCALAECLFSNGTLSNIYIWGNKHEESACVAFANLLGNGRLQPEGTDVRPYIVDGVVYLARLDHDNEYRMYRFYVPWCGGYVPQDRSIALF